MSESRYRVVFTDGAREAPRGRPAPWIRWHGALRAELPVGVTGLHLPTRSSRAPVR
ncbi:hypothetical protein AB0958_41085 [Streptomyces sp. NPDC006655]|uniref:hypothetical protein n=1 Tax=Streptomyces sp. NPDC006655 TaxID=3156898 RepID=UPI003456D83C